MSENDAPERIYLYGNTASILKTKHGTEYIRADLLAAKALPVRCDGKEQHAFEDWALRQGYDMTKHPLHYLFLDAQTYAARQAWCAAIEYCRAASRKEGEGG